MAIELDISASERDFFPGADCFLLIKRFRYDILKICQTRRVVRVVECAALEMPCPAMGPGFESLTLRQLIK